MLQIGNVLLFFSDRNTFIIKECFVCLSIKESHIFDRFYRFLDSIDFIKDRKTLSENFISRYTGRNTKTIKSLDESLLRLMIVPHSRLKSICQTYWFSILIRNISLNNKFDHLFVLVFKIIIIIIFNRKICRFNK